MPCDVWPQVYSDSGGFNKKERKKNMGIVPYALMTYGLTIVISLAVVAVIVVTNNVMNKKANKKEAEE